MKKWLILLFTLFFVIIVIVFSPHSLIDRIDTSKQLVVLTGMNSIGDEQPNLALDNYTYNPDSSEYRQIIDVLKDIQYHRSLQLLGNDGGLYDGDNYITFCQDDDIMITICMTNEIRIDGSIYKIEYFETGKMKEIVNTILDVLE